MKQSLLFSLAGTAIVCLSLAGLAQATVPRAFVSTNGDDMNPCSAVQPCRSFNQALTVVQPGGEIVVQNSGGYSTGFTITQSVTIDAAGFNASVISTSNTDLCTINAGPSDRVVFRGISFHGASMGNNTINVTQVGSLYVEHCSISEFNNIGIFMVNGGNLFVTDTDIRACDGGISATPLAVVSDSRFTECGFGFLLRTGQTGDARACLINCTVSECNFGFSAATHNANNADMTLINCFAVGNVGGDPGSGFGVEATVGINAPGNTTVRLINCTVTGNHFGIDVTDSGPGIAAVLGTNPGTNLISGNGIDGSTGGSVTLADWMGSPRDYIRLLLRPGAFLPASALASHRDRPERLRTFARKYGITVAEERTS